MKAFVVGITGETGFRVARRLTERGCEVVGLYRRPGQLTKLAAIGAKGVCGDLVEIDVDSLAGGFVGCELVVFTAGAGEADNDEAIEAVDGEGVAKSTAACALAGVRRFLLVSVFPEAGRGEAYGESFEHYIEVKKRAEIALVRTDLDWVILRPSTLINEAGVGTVSLSPAELHTVVRRDDLAATLVELAHTPALRHRILELTEGATPIRDAVARQLEDDWLA